MPWALETVLVFLSMEHETDIWNILQFTFHSKIWCGHLELISDYLFMKIISHNPKQYEPRCVEMYLQRPMLYKMYCNGLRLCERLEGLLAWNISGSCVGKGASQVWSCKAMPWSTRPAFPGPVSQPHTGANPWHVGGSAPCPDPGAPGPAPEWQNDQKFYLVGRPRKAKAYLNQSIMSVHFYPTFPWIWYQLKHYCNQEW